MNDPRDEWIAPNIFTARNDCARLTAYAGQRSRIQQGRSSLIRWAARCYSAVLMVEPFYHDQWLTLYGGDCRTVLAELPAESVDCIVTSPPYWGLRDYGTATWSGGDPMHEHVGMELRTADTGGPKQQTKRGSIGVRSGDCACGATRTDEQLGLEPTPELYVEHMVDVFRELRRVLKPSGTCWLNLGDSYAANQSGGDKVFGNPASNENRPSRAATKTPARSLGGLKPKDLVGIPWRVAFALQADGWYLRSDVIWSKPNPMPESVTDRPTKSHEYLFLLTKSARYYFDADAVREPNETKHLPWGGAETTTYRTVQGNTHGPKSIHQPMSHERAIELRTDGRNIRSVWTIATRPYPGAHFAVFPPELPERCIKAGSSEQGVCGKCGSPWRRITKTIREDRPWSTKHFPDRNDGGNPQSVHVSVETLGWERTCEHDGQPVPATVLDPFGGSGTVGMVANQMSRRAVLIDLNPEYLKQQMRRNAQVPLGLGMVAEGSVEVPASEEVA